MADMRFYNCIKLKKIICRGYAPDCLQIYGILNISHILDRTERMLSSYTQILVKFPMPNITSQ